MTDFVMLLQICVKKIIGNACVNESESVCLCKNKSAYGYLTIVVN